MSAQDSLSIGWSNSVAARSRAAFRGLLTIDLVLCAAAGIAAVLAPHAVDGWLGLEPSASGESWLRIAGGLLLWSCLFQIPLRAEPQRVRVLGAVALAGRFVLALILLWAGGAFLWLAAYELVAAVLLFRGYLAYGIAELMTRP
jgi:hypothetical protein